MADQTHSDSDYETSGYQEEPSGDDRTERFLKRLDIQHKVLKQLLEPSTAAPTKSGKIHQPKPGDK